MIAIVTDSTSDLPQSVAQEHRIQVVPLYIHIGESTFRAGVNLTNEQFLYRLQSSVSMPTTEPPTVQDFQDVYTRLLGQYNHIISIHISSKLSETYSRALAARQAMGSDAISVLDSQSVSVGVGLMALEAARLVADQQSVETIRQRLDSMIAHHRVYFIVNSLEYLYKGGRIGKARALMGTALQMKPIMTVREGQFEMLETVRTKPKAIARLRQLVIDGLAGRGHIRLAVAHSNAPDEARRLEEDLRAVLEPAHSLLCEIGPAVTTHSGPGTLGVAFYSDR